MDGFRRGVVALAGLMGACGVVLAALGAHGGDAALLQPASSMLLFHASAAMAAITLVGRGVVRSGPALASAAGFVIAAGLFSGDLTLRHFAGHGLFPFAPPIGGTLLIISWLALALAAAWPRRK